MYKVKHSLFHYEDLFFLIKFGKPLFLFSLLLFYLKLPVFGIVMMWIFITLLFIVVIRVTISISSEFIKDERLLDKEIIYWDDVNEITITSESVIINEKNRTHTLRKYIFKNRKDWDNTKKEFLKYLNLHNFKSFNRAKYPDKNVYRKKL